MTVFPFLVLHVVFFSNQLPLKVLYYIAFTHSCTHSHTVGGVSHAECGVLARMSQGSNQQPSGSQPKLAEEVVIWVEFLREHRGGSCVAMSSCFKQYFTSPKTFEDHHHIHPAQSICRRPASTSLKPPLLRLDRETDVYFGVHVTLVTSKISQSCSMHALAQLSHCEMCSNIKGIFFLI